MGLITNLTGYRARLRRAVRIAGIGLLAITPVAHAQEPGGDHAGHVMAAVAAADLDSHGIVVDFELVDSAGGLVTDEDFRGRYVLLGFGFTHCATVCPLMALNMGRVLESTDKAAAGIFVSVDTERDTPAITHEYASHFGDTMLGLGGSIDQINAAAKNFKVSYAVTKTQGTYTVQHTANVFLIDPDGKLADVFTFATAPDTIVKAIR
jgi:cytochrome oxidase Cu insertion factor (SCO1/SenC/PrrC family)